MAIHTPIISPCLSEAALLFRPTPVIIHFSTLLRDLSTYIEAERDLEQCGSWDLACVAWIRDAEQARSSALETITALRLAPHLRGEDLPLKRCAELAKLLIESDSPEQVRDILALPDRFPDVFRTTSKGAVARRVNLLIAIFHQHLNALARLPDFSGMGESDDLASELGEPALQLAPAA